MNLINPAWIDLRDLRFVSFELLTLTSTVGSCSKKKNRCVNYFLNTNNSNFSNAVRRNLLIECEQWG